MLFDAFIGWTLSKKGGVPEVSHMYSDFFSSTSPFLLSVQPMKASNNITDEGEP